MSNYVAAIDLGTTKVVTIIGEKKDDGFRVIAYDEVASLGISRGEVENIRNVVDAVRPTLSKVMTAAGIDTIDEVFVGIAGQNIRCIESRMDITRTNYETEISADEVKYLRNEMKKMRLEPGERILHVIPQTYNVDDALGVTDPEGRLGYRLSGNFHVIIGKAASIQNTEFCFKRLNLQLRQLILEPIASARAILSNDEKEIGVAMVDMGGGSTDLIIYHDGIVRHTAVVPWAGDSITGDIQRVFGITREAAECIKLKFGSCLESEAESKELEVSIAEGRVKRIIKCKMLAAVIEARMDEIVSFVLKEIKRSNYEGKLGAGIVFTGGGSGIKHLEKYIHSKTGMSFRIGKPERYLVFDSKELLEPKYATAIGLIMCGFDYLEGKPDEYLDMASAPEVLMEAPPVIEIDAKPKGKQEPVSNTDGKPWHKFMAKVIDIFKDLPKKTSQEEV